MNSFCIIDLYIIQKNRLGEDGLLYKHKDLYPVVSTQVKGMG